MKQETNDAINEVSKKSKGNDGTWHSIEAAESHHKMKYKTSETATIVREQGTLLLEFLSDVKKLILGKIFPDQKNIHRQVQSLKEYW